MEPSVEVVAVPPTDPAARRDAFLEQVVLAMGRYLAGMLSTRCTQFVDRGNLRSLTKFEETFDPARPHCRSCGVRVDGRVLCDRCRRITPVVGYGPTVLQSMYRSSHPRYEMTEDKKRNVLKLRGELGLATDAIMLCGTLVNQCWVLHAHHASQDCDRDRDRDPPPLNVRFDREFVAAEGSYQTPIACGIDFPVAVGGFGSTLRNRVCELAYEWLHQIDQTVRLWYDIPIARTDDEAASLDNCVRRMARLISGRVALLDAPHGSQADQHLSSEGCDHLAEIQHLRCKYHAQNAALNDVTGLAALLRIVHSEMDKQETIELLVVNRVNLVRMLGTPPPELLRILPTVMRDFDLGTLRDVLGNQQQYSVSAMAEAVMTWRASINASVLTVFVERARSDVNVWKPNGNLLDVVFSPKDAGGGDAGPAFGALPVSVLRHPAARLPAVGWMHGGSTWYLIPKQRHDARRTGLDSAGLRIVLLCSVVNRLLADENACVFEPGCVAVDVLCPLATAAMRKGSNAYDQLNNQLQPLTIGVEWGTTKTEIGRWNTSHIDNDVRDAVRHLSDFSVVQLETLFGRTTEARRMMGRQLMPRLLAAVRDHLVFKPPTSYTDFVADALRWALPIVRDYRQSIGFSDTARANPVGDLLRLHPAVREWRMTDGELHLTVRDLRGMPAALKLKLDELCDERTLVVKRRLKRGACWTYCLSESELYHVLLARESWG